MQSSTPWHHYKYYSQGTNEYSNLYSYLWTFSFTFDFQHYMVLVDNMYLEIFPLVWDIIHYRGFFPCPSKSCLLSFFFFPLLLKCSVFNCFYLSCKLQNHIPPYVNSYHSTGIHLHLDNFNLSSDPRIQHLTYCILSVCSLICICHFTLQFQKSIYHACFSFPDVSPTLITAPCKWQSLKMSEGICLFGHRYHAILVSQFNKVGEWMRTDLL